LIGDQSGSTGIGGGAWEVNSPVAWTIIPPIAAPAFEVNLRPILGGEDAHQLLSLSVVYCGMGNSVSADHAASGKLAAGGSTSWRNTHLSLHYSKPPFPLFQY
jgi:hypothetical protein